MIKLKESFGKFMLLFIFDIELRYINMRFSRYVF